MSRGRVCFVCGSLGAEATLHTKPHDKSPYFPFLEHHDPPKGSRLPGNDGIVDSCRVCYAFLTQQWETYERSRTPAIKRLYWLKRMDNGHFTGAEMRLQGEYIAQVMGLQYQPGVFEGGQSPNASREGGSPNYQDEREVSTYNKDKPVYSSQVENKPYRQEARIPQVNSLYANVPAVTVPVSLSQRQVQRNFSDGALDLSVSKKSGSTTKSSSQDCDAFICYICAKEHDVTKSKLVNSCLQPTKEPYFPILEKIPMPPHALPLTSTGQARVCVTCKNSLYQQWQAYEMSGIPIQHRTYKLHEDISHVSRHSENRQSNDISSELGNQSSNIQHVCYICGHLNLEDNVRLLYTVPPKDPAFGTLFFPFVRDLRRPHGAQPLKSDGTVLVCKSCYGGIYQQWQAQELSGIPLQHRQYSLSFLRKKVNENAENPAKEKIEVNVRENDRSPPSSSSSDVSQPLNIQISENGESASHMNSSGSQGLLAIAAPSSESNPAGNSGFITRRGSGDSRVNVTTVPVPHPLQQATVLPKRICFLCGEESLVTKAHILCSYPPRHETKGSNSQVVPFFPFLANRDSAPGAEPMSDDGTVISCNFCFSSLLRQWNEQEESKNPENNRWLRKYAEPDFVCFVCAKNIKRKNVRPLELKNFPFLREHKFPPSALLLDGGEHVAACKSCTYSLMHQFNEFERMGVPKEMRKYNWMQSGHVDDENSKDNQEEDSNSNKAYMLNVDEDNNSVADDGLPPGSKPPPLTMISPAASKLSRNTATVPPLNQVSPSNGVNSVAASSALNASRTSSFAAALRKLAQAKDPAEESSVKQTGSSSTSPRATTPKRGPPPPLVYTTQSSTSSLTSPPVVTIAPTQSHSSMVSGDMRQGIDRAHSVQSSVSSAYDQPLALKQERIERPQSTHSNCRDDDRLSVKDLQSSRSSRLTPHSGQRSSSPTSGLRDEAVVRGFQPYRPGDDVRHSLPPTYGLDPTAYPYPAFLPPHPFPHPAFRFDDPLLLERYRMMQPHYLPLAHPGLLPPTGIHPFLAGGRYPAELLHQQLPFVSQASTLPDQIAAVLTERQRFEEERLREFEREREKDREAILLREKEKARDREKEYDKERSREQYQQQHSIEHRTEKKIDHTVDRENHKERTQ
ncbi:hypothetical protein KUTeg_019153 [Tegillarca granosa]|uniref:Genetic suppressor element 1 n=1 Tax=Tegillarca granosa TaxID=220873 RepID=A0ABQ9EGQ0_TEGGR|nr:hypothetical protein KUTeg_019153 [Tegillarca granosa]